VLNLGRGERDHLAQERSEAVELQHVWSAEEHRELFSSYAGALLQRRVAL
jgi:hypothetical protein